MANREIVVRASEVPVVPAHIEALESTLSIDDITEMLYDLKTRYATGDMKVVTGFVNFMNILNAKLESNIPDEWFTRLNGACTMMKYSLPRMTADMHSVSSVVAFEGAIALSLVLNSVSSLSYVHKNSTMISLSTSLPFNLSEVKWAFYDVFISNVMLFWICIDQLDTLPDCKAFMKSSYVLAMEESMLSDTLFLAWMSVVSNHKLDKKFSVEIVGKGVYKHEMVSSGNRVTTELIANETMNEGELEKQDRDAKAMINRIRRTGCAVSAYQLRHTSPSGL